MLTIYILYIFIIVHFCIKMIMIGIKSELQEQLQYESFTKVYQIKIDVSASICSNFNNYLNINSDIIYLHTSPAINYKSYANHIS